MEHTGTSFCPSDVPQNRLGAENRPLIYANERLGAIFVFKNFKKRRRAAPSVAPAINCVADAAKTPEFNRFQRVTTAQL